MRRDDRTRLLHARDAASAAIRFAQGRTRADLEKDAMLAAALTRMIEVVGEPLGQVSPTFRESHAQLPWRSAVGMRNRLIHGYDDVDLDIIWHTVLVELPELLRAIDTIAGKRPDRPDV